MLTTGELMNQIVLSDNTPDFDDRKFCGPTLAEYLQDLLSRHGITSAQLAKRMLLDRSYGYQIFNGNRRPTRNHLLSIAILLGLDIPQTQRLLKIGGRDVLYPRRRFDAAIIYALGRKLSMEAVSELLDSLNEPGLL